VSTELDFLVLADRSVKALAPIMDDTPVAMLPIAGKAIIDHVVETIATRGPARISVCVDPNDKLTPAHVTRQRWTTAAITVEQAAPRTTKRRTLVLRGDILPSPAILSRALDEIGSTGDLTHDLSMDGIWLLPESSAVPSWGEMLRIARQEDVFLPDIAAYHRLALRAARGEFTDLQPGGWVSVDGIRMGFRARVETRRALGRGVEIGAHAFVDRNVTLGDNVVLGAGAYVARDCRLENVVVLPNTFVSRGFVARGAVIGEGWLRGVDADSNMFVFRKQGFGALVA
jgi:hypothetical protein